MQDSSVILYLFPCNTEALNVTLLPENQRMLVGSEELYDVPWMRPPESETWPCLAVRFNHSHGYNGIVAGKSQNADIVLTNCPRVSREHFYISFDELYRLFLYDTSMDGTRLGYNNTKGDKRRQFKWLLNAPDMQSDECLPLEVSHYIKFKIFLGSYDTKSQKYFDSVQQFHQNVDDDRIPPLREAQTMIGSHHATPPGEGPCHIVKQIGEGGFGTVRSVWNVSTGEFYVLKVPSQRKVKGNHISAWKKEVQIIMDNPHDHIIECYGEAKPNDPGHRGCEHDRRRHPGIKFQYAPFGSLDDYYAEGVHSTVYGRLTTRDSISILRQLLSALEFLHGRRKPIAHRDIKPGNILIMKLPSDTNEIYVKFADFGLAKAGEIVTTACGTRNYAAPELYPYFSKNERVPKYFGAKIDIFSLGLVIAELECQIPTWNEDNWYADIWGAITRNAEAKEGTLSSKVLYFVLENMLQIEPNMRQKAAVCRARAQALDTSAGLAHNLLSTPPYQRTDPDPALDMVMDNGPPWTPVSPDTPEPALNQFLAVPGPAYSYNGAGAYDEADANNRHGADDDNNEYYMYP